MLWKKEPQESSVILAMFWCSPCIIRLHINWQIKCTCLGRDAGLCKCFGGRVLLCWDSKNLTLNQTKSRCILQPCTTLKTKNPYPISEKLFLRNSANFPSCFWAYPRLNCTLLLSLTHDIVWAPVLSSQTPLKPVAGIQLVEKLRTCQRCAHAEHHW